MECQNYIQLLPRHHHRVRCESTWLGSTLWSSHNRRELVRRRISSPHQRTGITGGIFCNQEFSSTQIQLLRVITHGQCGGSAISQSPWGHEIQDSGEHCIRLLAFLPIQGHHPSGGIPTRYIQLGGGLEFPLPSRFQRLDARSICVSHDSRTLGSLTYGSFCLLSQPAITPLLQLEAAVSSGRFSSSVAAGDSLCVSPIPDDYQSSAAGNNSESDSGSDHSLVAHATVVSPSPGDVHRLSPIDSLRTSASHESDRGTPPVDPGRQASTPRVVGFGVPDAGSDLSQSARDLLALAWAPGTRSAYRSAWYLWVRWCDQRQVDPIQAPVPIIVNYMADAFEAGKSYSSLNVYRSAISAYHCPVDSLPVGKHPLVCRLLRGVKFKRPPRPRYQSTWDVSRVLDFFTSWDTNEALSLKFLSFKLTTLLCLVSIKRVSDVRALDVSRRQFSPEGVRFSVVRRTKTGLQSVFYPSFPTHPQLCVVRCLQAYEARTATLRSLSHTQLLLSYVKPHLPVSSATLARWVRSAMSMAGIDVSLFGAHSSRGAMATKVVTSGGSLADLLLAADWSSETTFRQFYFRPEEHVSVAVL
ncbi:uncharacterized protein LOC130285518 [Hyla sarda]|uniref:uncharacterized protein LOC130285518 n=1 Tax=Hyla sarda TaxID=327740 RepID=UPI0024C3E45A|nr:uncharacterized protein LOC130285518 [Hyla sarda]XP_056392975.1 uncharacterized protein LOC130285518 [Hyla sarda]